MSFSSVYFLSNGLLVVDFLYFLFFGMLGVCWIFPFFGDVFVSPFCEFKLGGMLGFLWLTMNIDLL